MVIKGGLYSREVQKAFDKIATTVSSGLEKISQALQLSQLKKVEKLKTVFTFSHNEKNNVPEKKCENEWCFLMKF